MVKVWFPNMFMRLISWKPNRTPPQALFNISPRMTKTEVKEYCNKIYGVPVVKVMTTNYLGRWKRLYAKKRIISYKRRNFKTALVHYIDGTNKSTAVAP